MLVWHLSFALSATSFTLTLLEDEMMDFHLDRRQLDDLMGLVGAERHQVAMATGTGARLNEMDLGGAQ